jgi:hypothetical protein
MALVSTDKQKPCKQFCGGWYYVSANDGETSYYHTEDVFPFLTSHLHYTHPLLVLHNYLNIWQILTNKTILESNVRGKNFLTCTGKFCWCDREIQENSVHSHCMQKVKLLILWVIVCSFWFTAGSCKKKKTLTVKNELLPFTSQWD